MRALVAYGTKYGSTEALAERIAKVLRSKGASVTLTDLRIKSELQPSSYDLVVVGSGIAIGSWSKGARSFLEDHNDDLKKVKLAMFASCGDVFFSPERTEEHHRNYLDNVAGRYGLKPFSMALFGGVLDFDRYGFLVNGMLNRMHSGRKDLQSRGIDTSRPYDFRDWQQVETWTASLMDGEPRD